MKKETKEKLAKGLIEQTLNAHHSDRLNPESFEDNDSYKIRYRFISNLFWEWEQLGFESFPTKQEVVEIAKIAHPYFVWLLEDKNELQGFLDTYEFHRDVREGI